MVMRRNRLWTDEEVLELRRLADEHLRVSAIARRLNRTVAAIRHKAWLEGNQPDRTARAHLIHRVFSGSQ